MRFQVALGSVELFLDTGWVKLLTKMLTTVQYIQEWLKACNVSYTYMYTFFFFRTAQQEAQRAQFVVEKAIQERQQKIVQAEGEAKAAILISFFKWCSSYYQWSSGIYLFGILSCSLCLHVLSPWRIFCQSSALTSQALDVALISPDICTCVASGNICFYLG